MNPVCRLLVTILLSLASLSTLAAVTASLDRDQIAVGESVRLLLQRDGNTSAEPDMSPLRLDFDVLGSSKGTSVQIINGHTSSQTQLSLILAPKHDGTIRVPPLQWGGEMTPALELSVGGGSGTRHSAPAAGTSHVFLTATPDQHQPYVQGAVVLMVKLYSDQPLYAASLDLPANDKVLVKQFGDDKQGSESRNGKNYQVVERRYLLFPQISGRVRLDGPVLDAKLLSAQDEDPFGSDPFFGNLLGRLRLPVMPSMISATRPIHLRAEPIELDVQPRPAAASGSNWLPAQNVTLEETWQPESASIHAGEPLTRHLHLAALGLTGAQLPDLNTLLQAPGDTKLYPDQARIEDHPQSATVLGSRDQDIAYVAQQPGNYLLPAVHLSWWDTVHNTPREVVLPPRRVEVLPVASGGSNTPTPQPAGPSSVKAPPTTTPAEPPATENKSPNGLPWPWISLALGLLWLGTLYARWGPTRQVTRATQAAPVTTTDAPPPAATPRGSAFEAFQNACRNNDPQAARRHLLEWASAAWPEQPPLGLNALSQRLGDDNVAEQLRQLDRACYMNTPWEGEALACSLPSSPVKRAGRSRPQDLPELYPET